ncbi:MAG: hypothetical protein ACRBB0_17700 [Pelagimonas sp.]|uniref:hypothetical protein n=1 Tax=Pelagimonas sp. TaxID=2073170 RepID=UPI003D6BD4D5
MSGTPHDDPTDPKNDYIDVIDGDQQGAQRRKPVAHGNDVGSLAILVDKFENQAGSGAVFKANGSDGQKLLPGKFGEDGKDFPYYFDSSNDIYHLPSKTKSTKSMTMSWLARAYKDDNSNYEKYSKSVGRGLAYAKITYDSSPGNLTVRDWKYELDNQGGQPSHALGDSSPSNGGNGGVVQRAPTIPARFFQNKGGKARDSQAQSGGQALCMQKNPGTNGRKYFGISFTVDQKAVFSWHGYEYFIRDFQVYDLPAPTDGISFPVERGIPGRQPDKTVGSNYSWLHPALVSLVLDLANDLFASGHIDVSPSGGPSVETLVTNYREAIKQLASNPDDFGMVFPIIGDLWRHNPHISIASAAAKFGNIIKNFDLGLDHFGHSRGYMPAVSVAQAQRFYEKKLKKSLPVAVISKAIIDQSQSAEAEQEVILRTIGSLKTSATENEQLIKDELKS